MRASTLTTGCADRAPLALGVLGVQHARHRAHLRLAEEAEDRHPGQGRAHLLEHMDGRVRRPPRHPAQAQVAVARSHDVAHLVPLHPDEDASGHPVALEVVHRGLGVELPGPHDHRAPARHDIRQDADEPADVEQRQVGVPHVVVAADALLDHRVDRLHHHVEVGQHGALGPSGGARGVHDQRRRLLRHVDLERIVRLGREHVFVALDPGPAASGRVRLRFTQHHDGVECRQRGPHRIHQCQQRLVDDDRAGAGIAQHVSDLRRHEPEVDRHDDRPQPPAGEDRLDHLDAVAHQDGDPVALADAASPQPACEPVHAGVDLTERPGILIAHERHPLRELPGDAGELLAVRHPPRRVQCRRCARRRAGRSPHVTSPRCRTRLMGETILCMILKLATLAVDEGRIQQLSPNRTARGRRHGLRPW